MSTQTVYKLCKLALLYCAGLVLLGVFKLYTQPDFLVTLSNQVWACF